MYINLINGFHISSLICPAETILSVIFYVFAFEKSNFTTEFL